MPEIFFPLFLWTVPLGAALFTMLWLPTRSLVRRSRFWRFWLSTIAAFAATPTILEVCGREYFFPATFVSLLLLRPDSLGRSIGLAYGILPLAALTAVIFCIWSFYVEKSRCVACSERSERVPRILSVSLSRRIRRYILCTLATASLMWTPHLAAFEIKLFPASKVYDEDTAILHERLGLRGQMPKIEDFEGQEMASWLRTNLKPGDDKTEPSAWAGDRASAQSNLGEFEIRLPKVRVFGVGLGDNNGGNERISVNGNSPVQLKSLPGHERDGGRRTFYVIVMAEPNDPDLRSVVFDQCSTVNFDHVIVLQDQAPQKQEKLPARLILSLIDGTRLVAYCSQDFVQISVPGQQLDLPFDRILSMQLQGGTNTATVLLKNGEKLSCQLRFSELKVGTLLGDISIPCDKIHYLRVSPRGEFRADDEARSKRLDAAFHAEEPSYKGKSLRTWLSMTGGPIKIGNSLDMLAPEADDESVEQQAAKQAVQKIGPSAVPFLLELLRRGGSDAQTAVSGFAALGPLAKAAMPELLILLDEPDNFIHYRTIWSIGHIGPDAKSAIPELLEELRLSPQPHVAAEALGNIGPAAADAVPLILKKLAPGNHPYDIPFIIALGKIGSKDAIPTLIEIAQGTDSRRIPDERYFVSNLRRHRAIEALGNIGPAAGSAVPVLIQLLKSSLTDSFYTERIIRALGSIGPNAKEAIPLLREIAERPNQSPRPQRISRSIVVALAKIQTSGGAPLER